MIQRVRDILVLTFILPVIGPIFLVIMISAIIFHREKIFFSQMRFGVNQKQFKLYKFRSMIINAQSQGTGLYSFADDKRITPFGKFIRRSSLDELPQLFNVIKGEMSFVGPRPAVVGELDEEKDLPSNMLDRFKIKPGLTGWAQIHGRDNLTWSQKIDYDLDYVSFSSVKRFFIDIVIIIFTPFYLLNFTDTYEKRKP